MPEYVDTKPVYGIIHTYLQLFQKHSKWLYLNGFDYYLDCDNELFPRYKDAMHIVVFKPQEKSKRQLLTQYFEHIKKYPQRILIANEEREVN